MKQICGCCGNEFDDEYATNWHLYNEAEKIKNDFEVLMKKLHRKQVKEYADKTLDYLRIIVRCCDQHAG